MIGKRTPQMNYECFRHIHISFSFPMRNIFITREIIVLFNDVSLIYLVLIKDRSEDKSTVISVNFKILRVYKQTSKDHLDNLHLKFPR